MQWLSLFTMTHRREIYAFYLVLFENKLGGRLLEGERLLETIRYAHKYHTLNTLSWTIRQGADKKEDKNAYKRCDGLLSAACPNHRQRCNFTPLWHDLVLTDADVRKFRTHTAG